MSARIPESAISLICDLDRARQAREATLTAARGDLADTTVIDLDAAWRNVSVLQAALLTVLLEARVSPKAAKRIALD